MGVLQQGVAAGIVGLALWAHPAVSQIVGPSTGGSAALAQAARMLGHTKRVLMVGAHPDDEDSDLLTWLVRREGAVTGYLALTRGEGGQNLIGAELGEGLGLLRSGELLAARRIDGARQFFTRAFDFGYSKSLDEALRFWPRDSLLKDAVRIVRRFRPQIMVTVFSGTPRDGHGQHQAAGWVAREAFRVAGDPARFPELAREEGLAPWTPTRLFRAVWSDPEAATVTFDGGVLDPEVGQSVHQIAMRGRSQHRSQDMGSLQDAGPHPIRLALLADRGSGGPGLFVGIDTRPPRPGSVEAAALAPYAAALALGQAGLILDATADAGRVVPGAEFGVELSAWNAGREAATVRMTPTVPDGWRVTGEPCLGRSVEVPPGEIVRCGVRVAVSPTAAPSTPYFLRAPRDGAWYRWTGSPAWFGEPFEPPPVVAEFHVEGRGVGGPHLVRREVEHRLRDQAIGEVRHPILVVPRVGVVVDQPTRTWPVGVTTPLRVTVTLQHGGTDSTTGSVGLELPPGWPPVAAQSFRFAGPAERRTFTFLVQAPGRTAGTEATVVAVARDHAGRRYEGGSSIVTYPHIQEKSVFLSSASAVRSIAIEFPADRLIGYVRGAADLVPEALTGAGLPVEVLDGVALERTNLSRFGTIVIGSRAYEVDQALRENNGRLLEYVRRGGNLVVQYQQQTFFGGGYAPYSLTVGQRHDRVADETAPVRVLAPDHPMFSTPNRIEPADWEGWVQERGLYFARTWGPEFRSLLSLSDPGEEPLGGGLLSAQYGKGTYTYTGLAFFRQLSAGVPGAFRLFANLLAAGDRPAVP